ncbi:aminotransferase class I/II-fold pyridoxal phosphate-dependent enzyme [Microlunatus elymi]|uniref:cysteine-S-conjugate beta-lyase n=2 Tax=Microlunatus elymi TaxID=2596828 RepID=A0A516Q6I1_9ACTN|nr:aminotransferase class I/II-fold pyridoxal phosphate-dependent enzyme [Microlunatus elymi]
MDFGAAPPITEALHRTVDDGLFGYLPDQLAASMSRACAGWQADAYGWQVDPGRIHPLPDVLKGLEIAIQHFSRPGSPVIMPVPAYMPFLLLPPALEREIIRVPLLEQDGRYGFDLDALGRAFEQGGDLVVLCNPYNPVGRVFSAEELTAFSEVVAAHGGQVFADEIHGPLVYPGARHIPYASISETAAGHTLTATAASKAWNLPGLKCAQLIINNDADAKIYAGISPFLTHGASNPGVVATIAAYTAGKPWLDSVVDYLDGNRRLLAELLADELPMINFTPPEGTYIGWLDCRDLGLESSPAEFFAEHAGVALTDGAACGTPGFARMIFATPRPILTEMVHRMADAVRTHLR